jgi:hypothetical protein
MVVHSSLIALPAQPPPFYFLFFSLFVDGPHFFSTSYVTYGDSQIFRQLKLLMIATPLLILSAGFVFHYTGHSHYFYMFAAYCAVLHFIRQEFGWMKISSRFEKNAPRWLYHVDVNTSYAMTIIPFLWYTRKSHLYGYWFRQGDLFSVPDSFATMALTFYFPIVAIFLLANAYQTYRTRTFNLSKFMVFLNTLFGWYIARVFVKDLYLGIWLVIFHHSIPYLFVVLKHERASKKMNWLKDLGKYRIPILYITCFLAYTVYHFLTESEWIREMKNQEIMNAMILSFIAIPGLTHFILDAFIWKKKYGLIPMSKDH